MFSSPKKVLADKLAARLDHYFVVDPEAVQLSLSRGTKVRLADVRLRAVRSPPLEVGGSVAAIEFSWLWGGDEVTSFVRETTLTIRGARLDVATKRNGEPSSDSGDGDGEGDDPSAGGGAANFNDDVGDDEDGPASSSAGGRMDAYVQQIMDHLKLVVTDVTVTVDGKLSVEASDWELETVEAPSSDEGEGGRHQRPRRLVQKLSAGKLAASVVRRAAGDNDAGSSSSAWAPLLEPIGYSMTVERRSGRRFRNFGRGLEVVGEKRQALRVHLGRDQVSVLGDIARNVADSRPPSEDDGEASPKNRKKTTPKEGAETPAVPSACARGSRPDEGGPPEGESTRFVLPFAEVEFYLPDDASVALPDCRWELTLDRTRLQLDGLRGIRVNGNSTLGLRDGWRVDFARRRFAIRNNHRKHRAQDEGGSAATKEARAK